MSFQNKRHACHKAALRVPRSSILRSILEDKPQPEARRLSPKSIVLVFHLVTSIFWAIHIYIYTYIQYLYIYIDIHIYICMHIYLGSLVERAHAGYDGKK